MNRAQKMSAFSLVAAAAIVLCGFANGSWLKHVPESARAQQNPLATSTGAVESGRKLFVEHCAACHGVEAEGRGKKPCLRSARVHNASDGELQWLLKNGELGKGMPSWSKLPEQQRWQLVTYLKSMDVDCTPN
jgi:mono/diheme cytochrome c family protein